VQHGVAQEIRKKIKAGEKIPWTDSGAVGGAAGIIRGDGVFHGACQNFCVKKFFTEEK
jgi:hypothetical protein